MMKQCKECKKFKSFSEYFKVSKNQNSYRGECRECKKAYTRNQRKLFNYDHKLKDKTKWEKKSEIFKTAVDGLYKEYSKNDLNRLPDKAEKYFNNPNRSSKRGELNHRFGITLETFVELKQSQNNKCLICNKEETAKHQSGTTRDLCVDHCHLTGKIRGLICSSCNRGLGYLKDNIEILKSAITYLEKADLYNENVKKIDTFYKERHSILSPLIKKLNPCKPKKRKLEKQTQQDGSNESGNH